MGDYVDHTIETHCNTLAMDIREITHGINTDFSIGFILLLLLS